MEGRNDRSALLCPTAVHTSTAEVPIKMFKWQHLYRCWHSRGPCVTSGLDKLMKETWWRERRGRKVNESPVLLAVHILSLSSLHCCHRPSLWHTLIYSEHIQTNLEHCWKQRTKHEVKRGWRTCACACVWGGGFCFHNSYMTEGGCWVEGHQGSSLTVVLLQQEVMSQVNVENVVVGPWGR